jgi:hypothetical protein
MTMAKTPHTWRPRKLNGKERVEEDRVEDDRDRDQCAVPSLRNIRLVIERD